MKTLLTTLQNEISPRTTTRLVPGMKPLLALLIRVLCAALLVLSAVGTQAGVVLTTLHSFQVSPNGANSQAGLVQGSDGNFYGTTSSGGTAGAGTVFKISTNAALTTLYSFSGFNDGANPVAGLVQGSDGNFYGTTPGGGTQGWGTVFKISTGGALTTLYSFTGGNDDGNPSAGLLQGSDGSFYGTTVGCFRYIHFAHSGVNLTGSLPGPSTFGTVFKISTAGALTTLYSFGVDRKSV